MRGILRACWLSSSSIPKDQSAHNTGQEVGIAMNGLTRA
jgi:hypothetical protein